MNKIIPIDEMYLLDYNVSIINTLTQYWRNQNQFSCISTPKQYNLLLYIGNCKAKYTLKNGDVYYANSGDIVYTPSCSEYTVTFYDYENDAQYTTGTNFLLFDTNNEPFVCSGDIIVFSNLKSKRYASFFEELASLSLTAMYSPAKSKAIFYEILAKLSRHSKYSIPNSDKFKIILKGIKYLEETPLPEMSIPDIAKLCDVSEIYFRNLFTQYSGMSPNAYKLNSKIEHAKHLLTNESVSIMEIAEICNFNSAPYFCKQFKKKTGMTPNEYRNSFKTQKPTS